MRKRNWKLTPFEPKEIDEQCDLFAWANLESRRRPELSLMFATLNGMRLSIGAAVKAKKAGMRAGAPDIIVPIRRGAYGGLFIELKRAQSGRTQDHQTVWLDRLREQGYLALVCHGYKEARAAIENYLDGIVIG